jgi:hypothetical protein
MASPNLSTASNSGGGDDTNQDNQQENQFELYKLAVEMADRISARRGIANTFFLTINTGLGSLLALLKPTSCTASAVVCLGDPWTIMFGSSIGLVLCLVWFFTLRSYRRLNAAKFSVILKLEQSLPVRLFGNEWDELKKKAPVGVTQPSELRERWVKLKDQYTELTNLEAIVPVLFGLIYLALIVRAIT